MTQVNVVKSKDVIVYIEYCWEWYILNMMCANEYLIASHKDLNHTLQNVV